MKRDLGRKNWMFPMPVLMIGTCSEDGSPDMMNAAWGGIAPPASERAFVVDKRQARFARLGGGGAI